MLKFEILFSHKRMNLSVISCTVEALLNQYSWDYDRSLDKKDKLRRLKCGFCHCLFKYQICLNHHVITKHMIDLRNMPDSERLSFILIYLKDDREISYAQFHNEYFNQKKNLSFVIMTKTTLQSAQFILFIK